MNQHDQKQLELFLQAIRVRALSFTVRRCGDENAALDVLQDTMMAFVDVAENYEQEAWKNLFYKILNRRIVDRYRKLQWRMKLVNILNFSSFTKEEEELEKLDYEHGEQVMEAAELTAQFEAALTSLPERQREAYLLRQWEQMSVKETAEIMSCSEGSVKTHLSRAMASLKQTLGDWIDE